MLYIVETTYRYQVQNRMKSKQRNNRHRYQCEPMYEHTRICEQLSTDGKMLVLLLLHWSFACGLCCRKRMRFILFPLSFDLVLP